jgi:hypothetical protein
MAPVGLVVFVATVAMCGLLYFEKISMSRFVDLNSGLKTGELLRRPLCAVPQATIKDWMSPTEVKICDINGKCDADLSTQASPLEPNAEVDLSIYYEKHGSIDGWMAIDHGSIVHKITKWQHSRSVFGSVGEIGVHHGKFWIPIAAYAHPHEKKFAVDVFGMQEFNVDNSGSGNLQMFLDNVKTYVSPTIELVTMEMDSSRATAASFLKRGASKFRMLSVDGGHTVPTTLSDLNLAACVVHDEGVVILDDFINIEWTGVTSAVFLFLPLQSKLSPFLWHKNKLYLTTSTNQERALAFVRENLSDEFQIKCPPEARNTRLSIGGHGNLCVGPVFA